MKILHLIPTYKPAYVYGGPIFSVSLLAENLAKEGHDVDMFTTTANGVSELQVVTSKPQMVDGVRVTYFPRWTKDHTHFSPGLFAKLWKDCKKYDVVHIHSWWSIAVIFSVVICWLRGVKPILSPRGMLSDFTFDNNHSGLKGTFHRTVGKFLLQKNRLHLTAEAEQKECESIGADSFVLPNFIQLNTYNYPPPPAGRKLTIVFLSRIHPKKNLEGVIEALSAVKFDFCFKIAGSGEETYIRELKGLAASKGLSDKIQWAGGLYDAEKFRFYATADLFILPSFNENFANVIIEVLSTGTPVLVSDKVGLSDYVKENGLGWTCGTEPAEIAEALNRIYLDEANRAEIRRTAPGIIERDFSPKSLTKQYIQAYQRHLNYDSHTTPVNQHG